VFGILVAVAAGGTLIYALALVYLRCASKPGPAFADSSIFHNLSRFRRAVF
jgi:hypothetical protein